MKPSESKAWVPTFVVVGILVLLVVLGVLAFSVYDG